jgi:hypothetical protein
MDLVQIVETIHATGLKLKEAALSGRGGGRA